MIYKFYLNILWSALLIRYASIYVPLALLLLFSQRGSMLESFSFPFWIISGILILIEKSSSYAELEHSQVIWRYFGFKSCLPVRDIISIKRGRAEGIIGKPRTAKIIFNKGGGNTGQRNILLHQFRADDIKEFLSMLLKANPSIEVDRGLMIP